MQTATVSTSVHTIETSVNRDPQTSYREWRSRFNPAELEATSRMYAELDIAEGTVRWQRFQECRKFAYFCRHKETGKVRVISSACRQRWCPICSQARSKYLSIQVESWIDKVKNVKLATLTMKHSTAPLSHQIKWLYHHFRQFRLRKEIRKKWHGGIWFFQLKRSKKTEEWHPHIHCVIDGDYIQQKKLSEIWQAQTGNSSIVDIRAIKQAGTVAEYVSRYCARPAKLSEYSDKEAIEINTVFHGRKLCGAWGTAKVVSFRHPRTKDSDKWQRIGSWKAIVTQLKTSFRALSVWKAFITNKSIPCLITIGNESPFSVNNSLSLVPTVGIEDVNGNFEEFL